MGSPAREDVRVYGAAQRASTIHEMLRPQSSWTPPFQESSGLKSTVLIINFFFILWIAEAGYMIQMFLYLADRVDLTLATSAILHVNRRKFVEKSAAFFW